eukprot:TRINITY_DN783_c0_g1_i1.p1 TRINITY_DN783_c0_g1~~TRINITY_DN783_c0_g1_i1.p1  ORF type:complete len:520 (-),score=87.26 TRINITY_DN783_c0_g1_i1:110-1669(-)
MAFTRATFHRELDLAVAEKPEFAQLQNFWIELSDQITDEDLPNTFIDWIEKRNMGDMLTLLGNFLIVKQIKLTEGNQQTMLREESVVMNLLSALWNRPNVGLAYLRQFIPPLVDRIGLSNLELDPARATSRDNVKKNMDKLLESTRTLLDDILQSADTFPQQFKDMIRNSDRELSKQFEVGYALVASLLFLRLINPTIIFPERFDLVAKGLITERKGLSWTARILQCLANQSSFDGEQNSFILPANRLIARYQARWNSFFQKIITGLDTVDGSTPLESLPVSHEDFINRSNMEMDPKFGTTKYGEIQQHLLAYAFNMEKQMRTWKSKNLSGFNIYYKTLKTESQSSVIVQGLEIEVPFPVKALFNWRRNEKNEARLFGNTKKSETIERINSSVSIKYSANTIGSPFKDRDFVYLSYAEILPVDNFAVMASIAVEREDCPPQKGFVRAEGVGAHIMRAKPGDPSRTLMTTIEHVNLNGNAYLVPKVFVKKAILKHCQERTNAQLAIFADPDVVAEMNSYF